MNVSRAARAAWVIAAMAITAACGNSRNYDNPEVAPESLGTVTVSTVATTVERSTTTVFVPSTAPTTIPPSTEAPPPATYAPTEPPPATPLPTSATTTAPPTTPPPTIPERYVVKPGDTLSGIANQLGVPLDNLLAANGLNAGSLIIPDQQLAVPEGGDVPSDPTSPPAPDPTDPPAPDPTPADDDDDDDDNGNNGNGRGNGNGNNGNNGNGNGRGNGNGNNGNGNGNGNGNEPGTGEHDTLAPNDDALMPTQMAASCQAPDSEEADGTPITFAPTNMFDRDLGTAWRCESGTPQNVTFEFGGEQRITSVGLVNGYAKVDELTTVDRYLQNHRISQVRWTFSDGTVVTQDFADGDRSVQSIDVDVTATSVELEVLATYPPDSDYPRDMVPISELQIVSRN